jgi:hypothetical protein
MAALRSYSEYFCSSPSALYHNPLLTGFTYLKKKGGGGGTGKCQFSDQKPLKLFMLRAS